MSVPEDPIASRPFTLDASYTDRQQIVILPDGVAANKRQEIAQAASRIGEREQPRALRERFQHAVQRIFRARRAGGKSEPGTGVWPVGRTEASGLELPPGHPQDRLLYIGHPTVPAIYYPAAEFHQRVFEHKFCEAVDLLMALGALKITVRREEGYNREDARKMDLPLTPTESLGGRIKRSTRRGSEILFLATFPGSTSPEQPAGLVWLPSERTWQSVVRARTKHLTNSFSLVVSYTENYGVDAGLKAKAAGLGLSLGGEFQEQKDTVWQMDAEFPLPTP